MDDINNDFHNADKLDAYMSKHLNRRTGTVGKASVDLAKIEQETGLKPEELPGAINELQHRPYKRWIWRG
jgi:hypothetical protein